MSEEEVKEEAPVEEKKDVPVVEEGKVSAKDIEVVEKELAAQDDAKAAEIKGEFNDNMAKLRAEMETQYKQQLNTELDAYKKQIQDDYAKKFEDVNQKLEDLTPRKGLVQNTAENPYKEIAQEQEPEAAPEPVNPVEAIKTLNPVADKEAADVFLQSLRK